MNDNQLVTFNDNKAKNLIYEILNTSGFNLIEILKNNSCCIGGSFPIYVIKSTESSNRHNLLRYNDIDIYTENVFQLIIDLDKHISKFKKIFSLNQTLNYYINDSLILQIILAKSDVSVLMTYDSSFIQVGFDFKTDSFVCTNNFINSRKEKKFYIFNSTPDFRKKKIKDKISNYYPNFDIDIIYDKIHAVNKTFNKYYIYEEINYQTGLEFVLKSKKSKYLTFNYGEIFHFIINCYSCKILPTTSNQQLCLYCKEKLKNKIDNIKLNFNIHVLVLCNKSEIPIITNKNIDINIHNSIITNKNKKCNVSIVLDFTDTIKIIVLRKEINNVIYIYNNNRKKIDKITSYKFIYAKFNLSSLAIMLILNYYINFLNLDKNEISIEDLLVAIN